MNISAIHHLYAFEDGDTITPAMGVQIDQGFGLVQYWSPISKKVTATDFTKHPATLYPQPYSTKAGSIIVPSTAGQQWYYNNISDEGAILQDGAVKSKFKNLFEVTTVSANGKTFPALKIKGNLASEQDLTDKYIYYSGSYNGKQIVCQQQIQVMATIGGIYKILLSTTGQDGSGDNVLSNDNDWVKYTAYLQVNGESVASGITYKWQHLVNNAWKDMTTQSGVVEISGNMMTVYNAAVEGIEVFRCVATYDGQTYYEPFEVSDVHDPYYIDDGCSISGDAVRVGEKVTFSPKVYDRSSGDDVTSQGWTFSYTFLRRQDNQVISDINVNSLTYDNINKYGGISVRIEASK